MYVSDSILNFSQREIVVSSDGSWPVLSLKHLKCIHYPAPCLIWLDDVVYIATLCSLQWVLEGVNVFSGLLFDILASENNLYSSLRAHDCYLSGWPRIVEVTFQVL